MVTKRIGANQFDVNEVAGVTMTVGAEAANVINVACQLTDTNGDDVAVGCALLAYLSVAADGSNAGSAHSSSPAIGTDGVINILLTDLAWLVTFEDDGDADLDFTETGTLTNYLNFVLPSGLVVHSGAITHAA
tara:strand:- start:14398 stop:14796 length:399 start_codon:yes stop_codon:yes gene_type:complete